MRTAARTAVLMAVLTLGSKLLGFIREMFLAGFFGTSYITDAYVMGTTIPGTLFAGILAAVAVAYMPVFSEIMEKGGPAEGRRFTNETVNLMALIGLALALLGILCAQWLIALFATGFSPETAALATLYLRVAFFYVFFHGMAAVLESYLQYRGVFLPQLAAGYFQSVAIIIAIVVSAYTNHYYLACGLLLGSALRMLVIWRVARRQELELRPTRQFGAAAKRIMALSIPVFLGSTVNQLNTFVDKWLASGLPEGSVSALNYGYLLVNLVVALTVTIIVTIIYPRLTQAAAALRYDSYNDAVGKGMNIILIVGIPFSLGCMLYSAEVVELAYQRGAFNAASTELTAGAFFFYAIGIIFISLNTLLSKVYYSMQNMKTPVVCGVIGAVTNIGLNLLLVGVMAHRGLALASSVAAVVNSLLLWGMLRRKHPELRVLRSGKEALLILVAAVAAVGASWVVYRLLSVGTVGAAVFGALGEFLGLLAALGVGVLAACGVYLLLLKLFKIEELGMLRDIIRK